jgi:hypothetical protein
MTRSDANQRLISLTREERQLLLRRLEVAPDIRAQLESASPHSVDVWMSVDQADDLREAVQDVLQVHGFDESYAPTQEGLVLERLVDKFFTG